VVETVESPRDGQIAVVDAEVIGRTAMALGAGRERKGEPIDHAVGCEVLVSVGDSIAKRDPLFVIHARDDGQIGWASERLLGALQWSDGPVDALPLFYDRIAAG
jgi:pyrimidine-nucleoside phosphorylase